MSLYRYCCVHVWYVINQEMKFLWWTMMKSLKLEAESDIIEFDINSN